MQVTERHRNVILTHILSGLENVRTSSLFISFWLFAANSAIWRFLFAVYTPHANCTSLPRTDVNRTDVNRTDVRHKKRKRQTFCFCFSDLPFFLSPPSHHASLFSTFACNLKKRPRCIQMHASFRWEHLLVYCLAVIGESFLPGCHFENRRGEVVLCWGHIGSIVSLQVNVLYMINVQISHI